MRFDHNKTALVTTLLFLLTGCPPKVPQVVAPPPPPPAPPAVEKTFGEIICAGPRTLVIRYKSIVVLTDPGTLPSDNLPPIDYLLLTDSQPHHLSQNAKETLRKDLKIIATDETVEVMKRAGFTQSKGLSHVQRLMLKKDDDFLFVGVVSARNPVNGERVNGYFLEFDNGRNIFISGDIVDEAVLREFVYGLRDDGKQIDLAFVYGGGSRSANEDVSAVFIGLLQPQAAYVLLTERTDGAPFIGTLLQAKLQEQMYSGQIHIPKPGEKIYF